MTARGWHRTRRRHRVVSKRSLRVVALALMGFGLVSRVQAQTPAPGSSLPRMTGTEISSEISWERRTGITHEAHTAIFGKEPFQVTFAITYQGLKLPRPPESVEVRLVRDAPGPADADPTAASMLAIIDDLPVPLTREANEGPNRISAVVPLEVFQWMVGGKTLALEGFGRRFVLALAASQIAELKEVAAEWGQGQRRNQ